MGDSKKLSTQELVEKIEKITKERIKEDKVVSLSEYRSFKQQENPRRILVIEDDETMRRALKRICEGEGYQCVTAADGTQLSQVLDDSPIDLIILDIGLPWINGFELAELMKAHKELKNIPLVFVTGRTGQEDMEKGFSVGADDYIKKPFEVEKIKKTINTLMQLAHEG